MKLGLFVLFSSSALERCLNFIEILVLKLRFEIHGFSEPCIYAPETGESTFAEGTQEMKFH